MPNAPNAGLMEVKGELKKMNKQLRQLIELKKQANLMAGCFFLYNCDQILIIDHQALEVVTRDPLLQIQLHVLVVVFKVSVCIHRNYQKKSVREYRNAKDI
jgi:hypothetical protein